MRKIAALLVAGILAFTACGADVSAEDDGTHEACVEALDTADEILVLSARGFGYLGDAIRAALAFDAAGVEAANRNLEEVTADIEDKTPGYRSASDECRGVDNDDSDV